MVDYPDLTPSGVSNTSNPYASGFPVDQQGFIQFPLIGRIKVSGISVPQSTLTTAEVTQTVEAIDKVFGSIAK